MSQRRCGTCRYFEEGTLAGSGWCRHPQRRDLQHMVLVRKSELACRAGWDQDLWEPKASQADHPMLAARHADAALTFEPPPLHRPPTAEPAEGVATSGDRPQATPQSLATPIGPMARPDEFDTLFPRFLEPRQRTESRPEEPPGNTVPRPGRLAEQRHDVPVPPVHGWFQSGETEPFPVTEATPSAELSAFDDGLDELMGDDDARSTPLGSSILPPLPRCCRTCRDFRPAGDGGNGWCSNPYAFPERVRVSADSLACYSSLGSWWLPSDDWWLQEADISHHGLPTPHVDEYLQQALAVREKVHRRRASS